MKSRESTYCRPCLAVFDGGYGGLVNAKPFCNDSLSDSLGEQFTDLHNIIFRKPSSSVFCSPFVIAYRMMGMVIASAIFKVFQMIIAGIKIFMVHLLSVKARPSKGEHDEAMDQLVFIHPILGKLHNFIVMAMASPIPWDQEPGIFARKSGAGNETPHAPAIRDFIKPLVSGNRLPDFLLRLIEIEGKLLGSHAMNLLYRFRVWLGRLGWLKSSPPVSFVPYSIIQSQGPS